MEISWLLFTTLFFILMLTLCIKKLTKAAAPKPPRLPPGPRTLPIIGNLHQLVGNNSLPHRRLHELAKVYGPIMHLRLGEVPTVIVSSGEVAREVLKTHDANFANRPTLIFGKVLGYDCSDIGFASYGPYWTQVRKMAVMELFSSSRVESFRAIREEVASNLINSIASEAASTGSVVNLSDKIFAYTFDIVTRIVSTTEGKQQEAFRKLTNEMSDVLSGFAIADLYPSIKFLPTITGLRRKLKGILQQSDKLLEPIIEEHKANINKISNKEGNKEEDLLDVLLKFHEDNNAHGNEFSLTTDNIKGIILEIYFAGTDTSSTLVEWAMSELLKNPQIMEKAQAEVREVYRGKGTVDEAGLVELKYLKLIIKESFRLHPPAPLGGPRESVEKCQICGYDILPKTRVFINNSAIGRDQNYWSQPDMFNPERFEGSSIDFKGNNFELIPFGAGRRMCPALALGVTNIELPLAMLLFHFDWKLPIGIKPQQLDMDEVFGAPTKRRNKLYVFPSLCAVSSLNK